MRVEEGRRSCARRRLLAVVLLGSRRAMSFADGLACILCLPAALVRGANAVLMLVMSLLVPLLKSAIAM